MNKNIIIIFAVGLLFSNFLIICPSDTVSADSYNGEDLAIAILQNDSWLIDSSYSDTDELGHRQAIVLSSHGTMTPTHNSTFALISTGIAGTDIVTSYENEPGDERGTWFEGNRHGYPRDEATLTLTLQVPPYMHYLYYDVQFFSSEYPEYVGTQFNDKFTVTVNSPSEGSSQYYFDVNSGYFLLDSYDITNTGFDIFATSGYSSGVDWVDTYPRGSGADAGASDIIPIGGATHPVSPNEIITVTFNIKDAGDNLFDSAAYIDNLRFSGYAITNIVGRKIVTDLNGDPCEDGDTLRYRITISNTGTADQDNNPGDEFEDFIPEYTTYVPGSATATSGSIDYNTGENKITWDGQIPSESSVILEFDVTVNSSLDNGTIITNQGTIYWDSNEDGTNDAVELTDDPHIDDGIDQDGDSETDDDDPTNITYIVFEYPSVLTEDFSDDTTGENATQSYCGRKWFDTSNDGIGSNFEVASGYYYTTAKSFKTQLRITGGKQYWNYTFDQLDGDMEWWEAWFACGDNSEEGDMILDFKNSYGHTIAKLKFEYVYHGIEKPNDWYLLLYYEDPIQGWTELSTDYDGGYLHNNWYKIRVEKYGNDNINYSLYRNGIGIVGSGIGNQYGVGFSNFDRVEFSSTKIPVVNPMFFWDEHSIGLT